MLEQTVHLQAPAARGATGATQLSLLMEARTHERQGARISPAAQSRPFDRPTRHRWAADGSPASLNGEPTA